MLEYAMIIVVFALLSYAVLSMMTPSYTTPRSVAKISPDVTLDRLNYLYHNDYNTFLTVKRDLEERGWKIIYINPETLS